MTRVTIAAAAVLAFGVPSIGEATAQTLELTVTRTIDAPAAAVWAALTEPERIARWWGPNGFTAPKVAGEVSVGSKMLVCMTAPGFPMMCSNWTYTEIVPGERLRFDYGFADENGNAVDPQSMGLPADIPDVVPHVVELRSVGEGRTELSWLESGYSNPETVALSKSGLDQVLDKLVASVEAD